ncbi:MAG: XdhC family protein [Oscillospiraceae bacterium]|nr:XdhC family protein [Oscillospiraceae bacterium]
MRNMLKTIEQKLTAGESLVLVTVIASSGATPRGAGARMLIGKEGRICGTIGGGAVEYRSEQIAARVLEEKTSLGHDFTLTKDDVQNLGMICGGACDVYFHYLPAGDAHTLLLCRKAEEAFQKGWDLWLLTDVGPQDIMGLYTREWGFWGICVPETLSLSRHPERTGDIFAEQINASGRVYIFGGGHVAQELVPVLAHVGFRCVVMDDRAEFTRPELFPGAEEIICGDLTRLENYMSIGSEDYVCVMTRGHSHDTVVQAQVLRCRPTYCGVIGSIFKAAGVRKTLKEEYGLIDEELDLVTTPIGLNIKGETPAEIAISIAAQMILHRAERNGL